MNLMQNSILYDEGQRFMNKKGMSFDHHCPFFQRNLYSFIHLC